MRGASHPWRALGRTSAEPWVEADDRDAAGRGRSPEVPGVEQRSGVAGGRDPIARILGEAYPLACHLLRMTLLFVLLLACIYVLRTLVVLMFPPGEYLRNLLDLVDTYAALAGTIGYVAWISADLFFLMQEQWRRRSEP